MSSNDDVMINNKALINLMFIKVKETGKSDLDGTLRLYSIAQLLKERASWRDDHPARGLDLSGRRFWIAGEYSDYIQPIKDKAAMMAYYEGAKPEPEVSIEPPARSSTVRPDVYLRLEILKELIRDGHLARYPSSKAVVDTAKELAALIQED